MTLFRLAQSPGALAAGVVARLSESFAYLASAAESQELRASLWQVADRLAEMRAVPPHLGCLYLRIVEAVDGGEEPVASELCARLLEILARTWSLEVARYGREDLGEFYRGFADVLFDDSYGDQPITEPTPVAWQRAKAHFENARSLVRAVAPSVHDEMEAFWSRIYVGVGNPGSGGMMFGGVTSLVLWGGTFANAEHYNSELKAADFLVHEVTHALLFALSCQEPLVLNPPEELFDSPLRRDPRPMDGIFHATLVCARLAEFYADLRGHGVPSGADEEALTGKTEDHAAKFARGRSTIMESGRISPLAAHLLDEAAGRLQALRSEY